MHRALVPFCLLLSLLVGGSHRADVTLPALVGDHMVLQCESTVRVWGEAEAGEDVRLRLTDLAGGASVFGPVTAGSDGRWALDLPAQPPGGPFSLTVSGKNEITLEDVWFGEVWVCSGQSNMVWALLRADDGDAEIAAANRPELRLFQVPTRTSDTPLNDVEGEWKPCTPDSARGFSAVGYFFGRDIAESTGRVVGLIQCAWGGTPAEAWTPLATLQGDPQLAPILEREARRPQNEPASLFNGMLHPLLQLSPRGVIWYQGEANANRAYEYRRLFPAMIGAWRAAFDQKDLPFYFVQLANFKQAAADPSESAWAELREAQAMALSLPNTGMAVTIDVGDAYDIHPTNKQAVGHRLALWARAKTYGEEALVHSGPIYREMNVFQGKVELRFDHMGSGLASLDRKSLHGFQIAGEDRVWKWAKARIFDDVIVVWREDTPEPVAVRYAWGDDPACNLGNVEGLPAAPFRTDDWKGVTQTD